MNVLQIITSLQTGGAEKLLVDIMPRLNKRGIQADILTLSDENTSFRRQLEEQDVQVRGLSKALGFYNPRFIFKVKPYLAQYDIVHTHLVQPQYWTAFAKIISPKSRAHLITTEHNTNNRRRDMKIMKLIDRKVYQQYEKIIAISDATASNLASYLSVHHEIMTIANGIDVDYFQNAVPINKVLLDPSIKDDDFIITMVGGFREQKDQDTIIKALRILPENIKLVLVGDGERRKKCEKLALKEGVLGRVLFLGIRKDVANILKASDVVVMSSHWEGFGLAVVEGMAAQKSVIASDVSGLSNIVKGAGLLFPPGDTKKLAQLIIDLEKNNEYAKQVASACYIRAKQYDINKMVDALIDVYSSILSPKK